MNYYDHALFYILSGHCNTLDVLSSPLLNSDANDCVKYFLMSSDVIWNHLIESYSILHYLISSHLILCVLIQAQVKLGTVKSSWENIRLMSEHVKSTF